VKKILVIAALATVIGNFGVQAKTLRWASAGDPQTIDPYSQNEGLTNNINNHMYETLVGRNEKLEKVPELAERWEQIDPLTWRFFIRKGIKFHDGAPLTAEDVVFSYERAAHPNSQLAQYARAMGKPTKIDEFTVEFKMEKPNPVLLEHATTVFIMNKAWCVKNKVEKPLSYKDKEETFAARNANGTGSFILKSREEDIKTVLIKNPAYWRPVKGNIDEVIYTPIKSDATRTAALLSGEVDIVHDPAPQDVDRLGAPGGATKVIYGMENRVIFLGFDQGRDELLYSNIKGKNPFKDQRVRQAFFQAIDINTIREKIMRNQSQVVACMTPSPLACEAPELDKTRLPYSVDAAKKLMEAAGYKDGFELGMDCPNNRYVNDEKICQAVASMLARINVKVKLNAIPKTLYFPKIEKYDLSFYMYGWGGAITDAQTTMDPIMHSRNEATQKGFYNHGRYSDPKLDALIDSAAIEAAPEKRKALIKEALTLHNTEVRHIVLHRQLIPWASRNNVTPIHAADNYMRSWWVTMGN
jgi:peptide/nickel transport system substrate-binding protein